MCSRLRDALVVLFAFCAVIANAASVDAVRFVASPSVVQMRIEVRSVDGVLIYDSDWKNGNLLDWPVQDSFGHPLAYGSYRVAVRSRDLTGQTTEKETALRVEPGEVAVEGRPNETPKITLTAHDGDIGQLVTSSGDLSFRFGDFLNRKDVEVMRLSAQGDLDVAGLIRTGKGIVFPDGTIQRSAALPSIVRMRPSIPESDKKLNPKSDISGTGTTNQMTKWVDGSLGTVGDSAVTEVAGKVGIGTATPGGQLHIYGLATNDAFAGMGPDIVLGPGFNYGYAGGSFGVGAGFFNVRPASGATGVNPSLRFMTVDIERMIVTNAGNIGIGLSNPGQRLEVNGNVRLNGGGALIFNDSTVLSTLPITAVAAGSGLLGGGNAGGVSLAANFTLGGPLNGSATTVARGDHKHYLRTVIINPTGTAAQNGTTLLNALAAITDNATVSYLLKIEPGTYDLGSSRLVMKVNVDIEGSGEKVTLVTGLATINANNGVVQGVSNAEIRFLTIECNGGSTNCTAFYNGGASPSITHVTSRALNGSNENIGIYNDLTSSPIMRDVIANASGAGSVTYGIENRSSSAPEMVNVNATGSGGSTNHGIYDVFMARPTMVNVRATASGPTGSTNYGIRTDNVGGTMVAVNASASGGTNAYGIFLSNGTTTRFDSFSSTASGATNVVGLYIDGSSPTLANGYLSASGGTTNNQGVALANLSSPILSDLNVNASGAGSIGVYTFAHNGTVAVHRSVLKGGTNSVNLGSTTTTLRIAASQLDGAISNTPPGTLTCAVSYGATFVALNTTCN